MLLGTIQEFFEHRLDLKLIMCTKKGSRSAARKKLSLDVASMFLSRTFSMNSRGVVGETLDKIIRCDGFNKGLAVYSYC